MDKQAVLDVLNSLEVIDEDGGDYAYLLVENNEENRKRLIEVGVTEKEINDAGDDKTFCILALAFNGGYADGYNGKLIAGRPEAIAPTESA